MIFSVSNICINWIYIQFVNLFSDILLIQMDMAANSKQVVASPLMTASDSLTGTVTVVWEAFRNAGEGPILSADRHFECP